MKKERQELESKLRETLLKYNIEKTVMDYVADNLRKRNIEKPEQILNLMQQLETQCIQVLFLLSQYLFEKTNKEDINPNLYFTEIEIVEMKNFKLEKNKENYPIVFEEVLKLEDDHYITHMTAQEIAKLYHNNLVKYNFETQRDAKHKEYNNKIVQTINVNKRSVEEITKDILENRFISNFITFNLLQNGEEEFEYDDKSKTLKIIAGEIDILDGFHRSLAILKAVLQNKNIKFKMGVNLTIFDADKGRRFIVQEDKKNKIDTRYIKSLNEENYANAVTKKINDSPKSDLQGKITSDISLIHLGYAYTLTDIVSAAIEFEFKEELKTRRDSNIISSYLIEFFNEVYGILYNEFQTNSIAKSRNIFIGYIAIAKELYSDDKWKETLEKTLNNIDFSDMALDINFNETVRLSKAFIKKISKHFKNYIVKQKEGSSNVR